MRVSNYSPAVGTPTFGGKFLNQEDLNAARTISQLKKSNTQGEAGHQDQFTGQLVRGQVASRGKPRQPKPQEPQKLKTTEEALKAVEIDDLNIHALKQFDIKELLQNRDSFALKVKDHENFFKYKEEKDKYKKEEKGKDGKTMLTCPDYAEHLNQMCQDKARLALLKMEVKKRHPLFNTLNDQQLMDAKSNMLESLADLYTKPFQLEKPFEANKTI